MKEVEMNSRVFTESSDGDNVIQALSKMLAAPKKKLTDWKNEPTVNALMEDYKQALPDHSNQLTKISGWLKNLNPQTDKTNITKGRSGIAPKVIRRLAEWRYSSLSSSILNEKNLFQVQATSPKYLNASIQNSLVLNHQFNNLIGKVKFINDLVRTMVNEGTAVVRVGWEIEQQTKEKEIPVYQYIEAMPEQIQMLMQGIQQITQEQQQTGAEYAEDTETYKNMPEDMAESIKASIEYGTPVIAVDTGQTQIIKEVVDTKNRPSVKVIANENIIIDPTCEGDIKKAKFVIHTYKTNLSELRMINQKFPDTYKNLDSLDPDGSVNNSVLDSITNIPNDVFAEKLNDKTFTSFTFKDKPRKILNIIEYWGYWDIDGTGIAQSIVATICNNTLIKLERNPFPDNAFPFVVFPYMPQIGSIYGEPDGALIEDNQQIIQALTRSIVDINARSANGQTAIPKGFLDPINVMKFRKGEDYEYNPMGMHPSEAIYMHTANELPQSVLMMIQSQYAEAEAATGVKAFQNGIDGNAYGQVVAGMSQALTTMTQREGDIIFRIASGLEEIGNKVVAMNSVWLNEEEVVAITATEFVSIKREDLAGDFFLAVHLKSNSESEGKAQQLTFMAQTLGQDADWGLRKMMMLEIGQLYNLETFVSGLKDYEPQPDPLAQEKAQLENDLLRAKLEKEQAEVEYFRARSAFIEAQVGNVQADTDLKALDFMEEQEGVKHARQREIVQAQAEAQNQGKIASEMLKAKHGLTKATLDNMTKERIAKAKERENAAKKAEKGGQSGKKFRSLPNPELGATPDGLFRDIGLGNYIRGDGNTVGNLT